MPGSDDSGLGGVIGVPQCANMLPVIKPICLATLNAGLLLLFATSFCCTLQMPLQSACNIRKASCLIGDVVLFNLASKFLSVNTSPPAKHSVLNSPDLHSLFKFQRNLEKYISADLTTTRFCALPRNRKFVPSFIQIRRKKRSEKGEVGIAHRIGHRPRDNP